MDYTISLPQAASCATSHSHARFPHSPHHPSVTMWMAGTPGYVLIPHEPTAPPRLSRAGTFIHLTHSIYEILNSHLCGCPAVMEAQRLIAATLGSAARPMSAGCIHPGSTQTAPQNVLPSQHGTAQRYWDQQNRAVLCNTQHC